MRGVVHTSWYFMKECQCHNEYNDNDTEEKKRDSVKGLNGH